MRQSTIFIQIANHKSYMDCCILKCTINRVDTTMCRIRDRLEQALTPIIFNKNKITGELNDNN